MREPILEGPGAARIVVAVNRRQQRRKRAQRLQHAAATRTPDRPPILISGVGLPRVDNGHLVPRMYQRAWEKDERQVAVHEVGKPDCELRSTKVAGTRGPLYRRVRPQGIETDDFEASLGGIEGRSARPLRELIAGQPITVERKGAIAQLLAMQIMRGSAFSAAHGEVIDGLLDTADSNDFKPRYLASVGGDLERARKGAKEAFNSQTNRLKTMLSYAIKVSNVLALMRWQLLRFPGPLLAYSDHPVVLWPMNVERSAPFSKQGLGPLTAIEVRAPIAPGVAILMNWIDDSDLNAVGMDREAAAELNAFTIGQAEREWMHTPGAEPEVAEGVFAPISRRVDPAYSQLAARDSVRRKFALDSFEKARNRTWLHDIDVIVDVSSGVKAA